MSDGSKKISSDRLRRVQETTQTSDTFKHSLQGSAIVDTENLTECMVTKTNRVKVGEWCFFKYEGINNSEMVGKDVICIGLILAFKYVNGRSEKEKWYKGDIVYLDNEAVNNLEALASWYQINDSARFVSVENENHGFLNIKNYIASVLIKPLVDQDTKTLFYSETDFKKIDTEMLKLI